MRKSLRIFVFMVMGLLYMTNVYAQPSNDACANATLITSSTTCSYSYPLSTGATQSLAPLNCNSLTGNSDDDVWFKFVAQASSHTITVVGENNYDPVVDIRSGSCMGTNIACADVTGGGGTETVTASGLTVGNTYLIRVYHFNAGDGGGQFHLCVTHVASSAPANNDCANATIIQSSTTCNYTTGSTLNATQSITGSCSGTGDDDVWYRFVAQAANHSVKVQGFGGFDPVIDIRHAPACSAANIMCVDATASNGIETANLTGLVVGATYVVRVYHFGTGNGGGDFDICVTHSTPPAGPSNDVCGSATPLTSSLSCNYTSGTTTNATESLTSNCSGATGDDDVWYSFVAQASSHSVKVQGAAGFDAVVDVRSSTSCTGTNISCTDASGSGGLETANLTGLTVGTTYLIRVYHYTAGSGTGNFQICVTHSAPAAPANDACASATAITSSTACSYTTGSTTGATQSIAGSCNGTGDDDVWYQFTAVATSHTVKVQSGTGFDAVIDVRSGSCTGSNIQCTDATAAAGLETANLTGLTVGNTYLIRVYHFGAGAGTGSFQICVTHTAPTAPANDACTSAATLTSSTNCSYTSGTTVGATQSIPGSCTGTGDDDVWYSFTAVSASHNVSVQSGTGFDAVIDVRTSPTCSGTNIKCSDISGAGGLETAALTGLTVGNTYMVRVYGYENGSAAGTFQICVTHTTVACTYSITPASQSFAATGGTGTVTVTATGTNCNWTAATTDAWITITSGSTGTGNGTVNYTVAANSGSTQRTGTITIAGQTHTVAQAGTGGGNNCTFTIAPLNQSFTSAAGTGSVTVTANTGCNWAATANDSWITVTSGSSGSGNGTVNYSVTANAGQNQRVGTITIAGQVHSITQTGVTPCSYTISPTTLTFNASGGPGTVNVTAGAGCNWTATANDAWISITSGNSGTGNGTVNYTVAGNTTTVQRTGTITVAGQTHTVTQSGLQCTYTISPTALSYTSAAGTGTVNVTAAAGCQWTATTTDSWITITSGSGNGNGSVAYSVAAHTGSTQRLGTISIAGQTHTVVQNGLSSCTYTLAPTSQTFTDVAGTGSFNVTSGTGCNWTAISNDSWIFITSGNTGTGNGTVNFSVSASTSTTQRVGTVTVGGQLYTVTQTGITCPSTPTVQAAGCSLASTQALGASYQWYLSGTPIIGATTQFYTANQPGFYSVYVTDNGNGCVMGSQPVYAACSGVGIEEYDLGNAVVVYPNPATDVINIQSSGIFADEKVNISIVNVLGQTVYTTGVAPQNGEVKLSINNLSVPKGTYSVLLNSGNIKIVKRVVIN